MKNKELSKLFKKGKHMKYYLLGFVDAEGCFSVSLKKQETTRFGWVLDPVFQVTQHKNHSDVLEILRRELKCGRITQKSGQDDTLIYTVDNRRQLIEKVISFFDKHKLVVKNEDFEKFKEIVEGLERKEHANITTFKKLIEKSFTMNLEGKQRRYKLIDVLKDLNSQTGSSETIRQTPKR